MPTTLQIKGDKKLMKMLRDLPQAVDNKVNRRAVNKAATPILQETRAQVPVDDGDLRRAQIKKITSRKGQCDGIVGSDKDYVGEKGEQPYRYDHLVHDGHHDPDGTVVPPNPYLQRAWDNSIGDALDVYESELAGGIESEAEKLGGG